MIYIFRGKCIETGKLVEGSYIKIPHFEKIGNKNVCTKISHYIISDDGSLQAEIDKKSLEMFTGIYDKFGRKIFVGDTINCSVAGFGIIKFGKHNDNIGFYIDWKENAQNIEELYHMALWRKSFKRHRSEWFMVDKETYLEICEKGFSYFDF